MSMLFSVFGEFFLLTQVKCKQNVRGIGYNLVAAKHPRRENFEGLESPCEQVRLLLP